MNSKEVTNSVAYCGLICSLCHGASTCGGCKSIHNCCGRHTSQDGCFQYNCCVEKGIDGCWECDIAPCDKDMFSEHHDIRNKTFIKVAMSEGVEQLANYVTRNQEAGILYGYNQDYDNLGSEEAVIDLLHKGVDSKYCKKRG